MENTPPQEKFNPFSALPAYERVKLEIFDRYLKSVDAWSVAAGDASNQTSLQRATLKLVEWYVTIHGFTEKRKRPGLEPLQKIMLRWHELAAGKQALGITALINHTKLAELVLEASLYMNDLGITSILQRHREDKYYLAEGVAER